MNIILASNSQRRIDLLTKAGIRFKSMASHVKEATYFCQYQDPVMAVQQLALAKAREVLKIHLRGGQKKSPRRGKAVVVGADTIIVFMGKVIGKPKNQSEAISILQSLSGQKHQVITGVALVNESRQTTFFDLTTVWFKRLKQSELKAYLDTGMYLDRAGAYGIQDPQCNFVCKYKGSYDNILGLPTKKLLHHLKSFGINNKKEGKNCLS